MKTSQNIPTVEHIPTGWGAPRYKVEGIETQVVILRPHFQILRAYSRATVKELAAVIGIPWRTMAGYFAGHDPSPKIAPLMNRLFDWGRAQEIIHLRPQLIRADAPPRQEAGTKSTKTPPPQAAKKSTSKAAKAQTQRDAIVPRGTRKVTQSNATKGGKKK